MWDAGCGELRPLPKFNFFCFLFSVISTLSNEKKIAFNSWTITKKERKNTVVSDAEAFRAIVDNDFSEISLDIAETEAL